MKSYPPLVFTSVPQVEQYCPTHLLRHGRGGNAVQYVALNSRPSFPMISVNHFENITVVRGNYTIGFLIFSFIMIVNLFNI